MNAHQKTNKLNPPILTLLKKKKKKKKGNAISSANFPRNLRATFCVQTEIHSIYL